VYLYRFTELEDFETVAQHYKLLIRGVAVKFLEYFYCQHTVWGGVTFEVPLEQLCTLPSDAVTVGTISGTPVVELLF